RSRKSSIAPSRGRTAQFTVWLSALFFLSAILPSAVSLSGGRAGDEPRRGSASVPPHLATPRRHRLARPGPVDVSSDPTIRGLLLARPSCLHLESPVGSRSLTSWSSWSFACSSLPSSPSSASSPRLPAPPLGSFLRFPAASSS